MAVPLDSTTGARGAIVVSRQDGDRPFRAADLSMAGDFASQAVIALEPAEVQHLQHQLNALEDRDRIARDLHDHVIQSLFATGMSLQSAAVSLNRVQHLDGTPGVGPGLVGVGHWWVQC